MNLERVLMPRNKQTFVSVYQVFELMESFVRPPPFPLSDQYFPLLPYSL